MTHRGWLIAAALVIPAVVAAQEAADAGVEEEKISPDIALPGSTGTMPGGKGSGTAGRIEVGRPPERGVPATNEDLPTWLGELLGFKKSPPPGAEKKPSSRHLTVMPFLSSSPVTGVGFGVAAAGTIQFGDP